MHGMKDSFLKSAPVIYCEPKRERGNSPSKYWEDYKREQEQKKQEELAKEVAAANCDFERRQALQRIEQLEKELVKKNAPKKSLKQRLGLKK